jgi:thioredoxin 1
MQGGVMSHYTREVNEQEFEDIVLQSNEPVLVDFWAPWCGPCRAMAPILDAVAQKHEGSAKVLKVNVDENPSTSARYNIRGIPTLILFKGGQEAGRLIGLQDADKVAALIA